MIGIYAFFFRIQVTLRMHLRKLVPIYLRPVLELRKISFPSLPQTLIPSCCFSLIPIYKFIEETVILNWFFQWKNVLRVNLRQSTVSVRFLYFILIFTAYCFKLRSPPTFMLSRFFIAELLKKPIFNLPVHTQRALRWLYYFPGLHHKNWLFMIALETACGFFIT